MDCTQKCMVDESYRAYKIFALSSVSASHRMDESHIGSCGMMEVSLIHRFVSTSIFFLSQWNSFALILLVKARNREKERIHCQHRPISSGRLEKYNG